MLTPRPEFGRTAGARVGLGTGPASRLTGTTTLICAAIHIARRAITFGDDAACSTRMLAPLRFVRVSTRDRSRWYLCWGGQPKPHRLSARLATSADVKLCQDRRDVMIDGLLRHDQALSNLRVAQPLGEQREHF